jgi:hypothetical protein
LQISLALDFCRSLLIVGLVWLGYIVALLLISQFYIVPFLLFAHAS